MKISKNSLTAFAGALGGSALGMGVNLWNKQSLFGKCIKFDPSLLDYYVLNNSQNVFSNFDFQILGRSVFGSLNDLKQSEIKTHAFVVPFFPLVIDMGYTSASKAFNQGIAAGFNELKVRVGDLPFRKLAAPVVANWLGKAVSLLVGQCVSSNHPKSKLYHFSPSTEAITKLAAAMSLYQSIEIVQDNVEKTGASKKRYMAAIAQAVILSATDAVMMYQTALHQSTAEMIAGGLIFAAAYPVAGWMTSSIFKSKINS